MVQDVGSPKESAQTGVQQAMEALQAMTATQAKEASTQEPMAQGIHPLQAQLLSAIQVNEEKFLNVPIRNRLEMCMHWWETHATSEVLQLIREGVKEDRCLPLTVGFSTQEKTQEELKLAERILEDYEKSGAVRKVNSSETRHLIPWFILSKEENGSTKHRFITDCRSLNQNLSPTQFKLDTLQVVYPYLKKGW